MQAFWLYSSHHTADPVGVCQETTANFQGLPEDDGLLPILQPANSVAILLRPIQDLLNLVAILLLQTATIWL